MGSAAVVWMRTKWMAAMHCCSLDGGQDVDDASVLQQLGVIEQHKCTHVTWLICTYNRIMYETTDVSEYTECRSRNTCYVSTCSSNLLATTCSTIFDTKLKLVIGWYKLTSSRWSVYFLSHGQTMASFRAFGKLLRKWYIDHFSQDIRQYTLH